MDAMNRGWVISDLHLLTDRTDADRYLGGIYRAAGQADAFVLNGDTFDFKWCRQPSIADAVNVATAWLTDLAASCPACQFYVLLGNHDSHPLFVRALAALASRTENLDWRPHHLLLGERLFLHGDVPRRNMSSQRLDDHRRKDSPDQPKSALANRLYNFAVRAHCHRLVHGLHRRRSRAARILAYLRRTTPELLPRLRHVYFGHTHVPFSGYVYKGVTFHNSGSTICRMMFRPLSFRFSDQDRAHG